VNNCLVIEHYSSSMVQDNNLSFEVIDWLRHTIFVHQNHTFSEVAFL